ncbi:MAG TPA: LysR family transcriptional regulator [Acidimicrobiales bacterium]|nr:LysR family transcriptional regulator [Acidimicrobiales bacterium]
MTLGQLRTFLAVAATGSVRAAAEQLVVTQPAVSSALAALQREVGVALVAREGRGLRITAAGQEFAGYVRRSLALLEEAKEAAAGRAGAERNRLRVAAVTTAGERILPLTLRSFRTQFPDTEISIGVGNRERVWDLLVHRDVDLALGGRPPAGLELVSLAIRPHRLIVAAAAPGPGPSGPSERSGAGTIGSWREVSRHDLAKATWLVRELGSGTRSTTEEVFADLGLTPLTLTLGSNGAIRESVQIGLGITLISADSVAAELEAQSIEEWRFGPLPLHREWHLVARDGEPLAVGARHLLEHLAAGGLSGPAGPPSGGDGTERFHLTPDGLAVISGADPM